MSPPPFDLAHGGLGAEGPEKSEAVRAEALAEECRPQVTRGSLNVVPSAEALGFDVTALPGLKMRNRVYPTLSQMRGKDGAPSITVSALSRDTTTGEGFCLFPSWKIFSWFVPCFCFSLIAPRLAYRILRWKPGSTNHLFDPTLSDH